MWKKTLGHGDDDQVLGGPGSDKLHGDEGNDDLYGMYVLTGKFGQRCPNSWEDFLPSLAGKSWEIPGNPGNLGEITSSKTVVNQPNSWKTHRKTH